MEMLGFKTKTYFHQISLPNSIYCVWVRKIKVFYNHDIFLGGEIQLTDIVRFFAYKNEPCFITTVQYCRILLITRKTNIDGNFLRWRCIVVMQCTYFAGTSTYVMYLHNRKI